MSNASFSCLYIYRERSKYIREKVEMMNVYMTDLYMTLQKLSPYTHSKLSEKSVHFPLQM